MNHGGSGGRRGSRGGYPASGQWVPVLYLIVVSISWFRECFALFFSVFEIGILISLYLLRANVMVCKQIFSFVIYRLALWMNLLVIGVEDLEGEEEVQRLGLLEIVLGMETINTVQCKRTLRSPM